MDPSFQRPDPSTPVTWNSSWTRSEQELVRVVGLWQVWRWWGRALGLGHTAPASTPVPDSGDSSGTDQPEPSAWVDTALPHAARLGEQPRHRGKGKAPREAGRWLWVGSIYGWWWPNGPKSSMQTFFRRCLLGPTLSPLLWSKWPLQAIPSEPGCCGRRPESGIDGVGGSATPQP